MGHGHPTDALGRVLPEPGWPDDRVAPGALELVRRFVNTTNRENGADRLDTPTGLDTWLAGEGLEPISTDRAGLRRVIRAREALHAAAVAHTAGADPGPAMQAFAASLDHVRVGFVAAGPGLRLQPVGEGRTASVDALLGRLALVVVDAETDGSWRRIKACSHCHWVVFDGSKSHTLRWCSMTACGGREKARDYRRRHATES